MYNHRHTLSTFFSEKSILKHGTFNHLDETQSSLSGALVFCQTYEYLLSALKNPCVSALITTPELAPKDISLGVVVSADPRLSFFKVYNSFEHNYPFNRDAFGIGKNCKIHPTAQISSKSHIGDSVTIGENVVIKDYVSIGDGSRIDANVVIGADGLMTVWQEDNTPLFIPHAGSVKIGRKVVIHSGAVIAKSLYSQPTEIGDYCQIGILTNVGHGAQLGESCIVSGNSIIAGRTTIGSRTRLGMSSSIAQGIKIGTDVQIKMGSVVVKDIKDNEVVSGNFAIPHQKNIKLYLERSK